MDLMDSPLVKLEVEHFFYVLINSYPFMVVLLRCTWWIYLL